MQPLSTKAGIALMRCSVHAVDSHLRDALRELVERQAVEDGSAAGAHQLVELLLGEAVAKRVLEVGAGDEAVLVLVEQLEGDADEGLRAARASESACCASISGSRYACTQM